MSDVTKILLAIAQGDPSSAEELLPVVYAELRKLAAARLAQEKPGQTLQATALVHEAYLRLVDVEKAQHWNSRKHFFGAASEAMRRILVEQARRKNREKHGGGLRRRDLSVIEAPESQPDIDILAVNEALTSLSIKDSQAAELVKLRYFAGFTLSEAASVVGIPIATADRRWRYARAWLARELRRGLAEDGK